MGSDFFTIIAVYLWLVCDDLVSASKQHFIGPGSLEWTNDTPHPLPTLFHLGERLCSADALTVAETGEVWAKKVLMTSSLLGASALLCRYMISYSQQGLQTAQKSRRPNGLRASRKMRPSL
ncbi:hypothetical protein F5I97DRAFT_824306 [Phlebopus sp. FC_14]|nr:hypothetical protein F5I97DRAFT_824306 [Phlebopus sp. FC_14]